MDSKIKTIIIGGTYNPVHIGHMHLLEELRYIFKPDKIILVPSHISAHKTEQKTMPAEHRLKMLEIACRRINVIIEKCEIERKGISYSIDTIRYIKEKYRLVEKPGLVIGDDLAEKFDTWKNPESIAEEAQLIVAHRNPQQTDVRMKYDYTRVNNLVLDISSTDIRNRIKSGRACRFLMPDGVYDYIISQNLYGE